DDGVRLFHDGAVGEQFALAGQAAGGCVVAHGSPQVVGQALACARRGCASALSAGMSMPISPTTSSPAIAPHCTARSTNHASARAVAGSSSTAPGFWSI